MMSPLSSATTQRVLEGHETPKSVKNCPAGSKFLAFQAPFAVGVVEVRIFSAEVLAGCSMATHREIEGQEIPSRSLVPSIAECSCQAGAPPVGFVEVTELPLLSTAAQNAADGHDTAVRMLPESTRTGADHLDAPPAG